MRKVLSVLLSVLCLTLIVSATISALPSFTDNGYHVVAGDCTSVETSYVPTGNPEVDAILADPTVSTLRTLVDGIPSDAEYYINLADDFFEVEPISGCTIPGQETGAVTFTVEHSKIIPGSKVGVVHYSTVRNVFEYVAADTVDTSAHVATITLSDASPVIFVIANPFGGGTPQPVVDTATK